MMQHRRKAEEDSLSWLVSFRETAAIVKEVALATTLPIAMVGLLTIAVADETQRSSFANITTNIVMFCLGGSTQRLSRPSQNSDS